MGVNAELDPSDPEWDKPEPLTMPSHFKQIQRLAGSNEFRLVHGVPVEDYEELKLELAWCITRLVSAHQALTMMSKFFPETMGWTGEAAQLMKEIDPGAHPYQNPERPRVI